MPPLPFLRLNKLQICCMLACVLRTSWEYFYTSLRRESFYQRQSQVCRIENAQGLLQLFYNHGYHWRENIYNLQSMEHDGLLYDLLLYSHFFCYCRSTCMQGELFPKTASLWLWSRYYSLLTEHRRIQFRITVSIDHEYHLNNLMNTPHQIHQLRNIPYILMGGWFIVGPAESLTEHETEGETNQIGQSVSWL